MEALKRRVVCAAIRHRKTGRIICGPRHFHCFQKVDGLRVGEDYPLDEWEQGFVDQQEAFMSREEALFLAKLRCQLQRKTGSLAELYSEDLY